MVMCCKAGWGPLPRHGPLGRWDLTAYSSLDQFRWVGRRSPSDMCWVRPRKRTVTWELIFGGQFHARVSKILDIECHIIHGIVIEHISSPSHIGTATWASTEVWLEVYGPRCLAVGDTNVPKAQVV